MHKNKDIMSNKHIYTDTHTDKQIKINTKTHNKTHSHSYNDIYTQIFRNTQRGKKLKITQQRLHINI